MSNQPKGTLHTRTFGPNEPVTATCRSKKHGHLVLIKGQLLSGGRAQAFYGRAYVSR